jgi:hypothetical protein
MCTLTLRPVSEAPKDGTVIMTLAGFVKFVRGTLERGEYVYREGDQRMLVDASGAFCTCNRDGYLHTYYSEWHCADLPNVWDGTCFTDSPQFN